jgi:phosphoglycerol transferase MdoB-like AlkP superfamily enzyme
MCAILSIELIIRSNDVTLTRYYTSTPSFAFNLLFVGVLYLLVTSVLGLKLGTIMALLVQAFLMLANYLKLTYFSEPFFPWDFGLVGDAVAISRDYISVYTIAIVAVIVLAGIILIVRNFKKVLRFLTPKPNIAMAAVMILPLVFSLNLLSHSGLKQINVFKGWYDGVNEYIKNGTYVENTLYLQNIKNYVNSKPADYSRQAMKQFEDKLGGAAASGNKKPDIIVILGETYWNPENMSGVTFNKEIAPNLKKYQSGTMISPAFGGGTANVEFEVLTGLSNFFFNQSIIPYNVYFKRTFPSIIGAFKDSGYAAVAVHPNDGEFYNRAKVYKYMGFDKFEDIKSFDPSTQTKGNYVSDDNLVNKIEGILKEESGPVFIQGVTMQNHDPYTNEIKHYGSGREIQAESDKLNTDEKDVLSNFAQGVYDEDKALGKLIEVAKKNDRPTIILMYGDHLPRLGVGLPQGNYEIFDKLGYTEGKADPRSLKKFFETPYVLWSNYGELPRLNAMVSPSQLSLELLKDAGIKYPSYFNSLLELREKHPYLNSYLDSKTGLANDKSVQDYYKMQYDIMFGSRYLLKK